MTLFSEKNRQNTAEIDCTCLKLSLPSNTNWCIKKRAVTVISDKWCSHPRYSHVHHLLSFWIQPLAYMYFCRSDSANKNKTCFFKKFCGHFIWSCSKHFVVDLLCKIHGKRSSAVWVGGCVHLVHAALLATAVSLITTATNCWVIFTQDAMLVRHRSIKLCMFFPSSSSLLPH